MKGFNVLTKDKQKKTQNIKIEIGGVKKALTIKDYGDETENLRAICRELKKFEDTLSIK